VRRAVEGAKQAAVAPLTREDARCSRRGTRLSRYQGFKAVVLDHLPCPQGPSLPYLYTPHNSACASLRFTRLQHERLRPHFYHPRDICNRPYTTAGCNAGWEVSALVRRFRI
jgi:hypothetical protein